MSVTAEELEAVRGRLIAQHGLDMMGLVSLADFVVVAAGPADPAVSDGLHATVRVCIGARLAEIGKTWSHYTAACHAMYAARHTVAELNAIPD
ncbi:hypothetical protein [Cupriavidus sp. YAF13]|uniref:hypothetical protein n=1 Tax=Cupriavidus sp. YAF13 TaxID=3233075 RepID=UPI003F93DC8F